MVDDRDIEMEDADSYDEDDTTNDDEETDEEVSEWSDAAVSEDSEESFEVSKIIYATAGEFLESEYWARSQEWHSGPIVPPLTPSDSKEIFHSISLDLSQGPVTSLIVLLREEDLLSMQKAALREGLMVRAYVPKDQYGTEKQGLLFIGWEMAAVGDLLEDVCNTLHRDGFLHTARRLQHASDPSRPRYMTGLSYA